MNDILNNKYKLLELENSMYVLFIIASIIDLNANKKLKNFYDNNESPNNCLRDNYIIASYLILFVFIVFMLRNWNNLSKLTITDEEYQYAYVRYIGSLLIVLGQILVIYFFSNTTIFTK